MTNRLDMGDLIDKGSFKAPSGASDGVCETMKQYTILNDVNIEPWLWLHSDQCGQGEHPHKPCMVRLDVDSLSLNDAIGVNYSVNVGTGVSCHIISIKPLPEPILIHHSTLSNKILWNLNTIFNITCKAKLQIECKWHHCKIWYIG